MVRHVCGISGGKDSSALAVYMRDKVPNMSYHVIILLIMLLNILCQNNELT